MSNEPRISHVIGIKILLSALRNQSVLTFLLFLLLLPYLAAEHAHSLTRIIGKPYSAVSAP